MKADSGSARPSRDRTVLINSTPVLDAIGANTTFGPTFSQEGPLQTRAYITTLVGLLVAACSHTTRTVIVEPSPELRSGARVEAGSSGGSHPSTAATLGIPPGHLPNPGECRVWIPGTPPGHQPKPQSRACPGIATVAPAGSWIVYRPTDDRKLVHVREVDPHRAGVVVRIRIFDIESRRLIHEEQL